MMFLINWFYHYSVVNSSVTNYKNDNNSIIVLQDTPRVDYQVI